MATERFDSYAIKEVLTTSWLGREIQFYPSVTSTNDVLKELASSGAPAGTLVLADYQRQGRGRMDRRWDAPPGTSLLVSALFQLEWPLERINWLTMIAGLAVARSIEETTGLSISLKWPNDVMLIEGAAEKKVAGILLESGMNDTSERWVVVGTGINVNIPVHELPQGDLPATSLHLSHGRPVARLDLLNSYLLHLERAYSACRQGLSPHAAWIRRLSTLGRRVRVAGPGLAESIEGLAESADETGNLLIRDDQGRLHAVAAGDVTLRV